MGDDGYEVMGPGGAAPPKALPTGGGGIAPPPPPAAASKEEKSGAGDDGEERKEKKKKKREEPEPSTEGGEVSVARRPNMCDTIQAVIVVFLTILSVSVSIPFILAAKGTLKIQKIISVLEKEGGN